MCILHIGSYVFILEVFCFFRKNVQKRVTAPLQKKTSKKCAPGDHSEHLKSMKFDAGEDRNRKTNPKSDFFEDAILRRFLALPKSAQNSKIFVYRATASSCHRALALAGERKGRTLAFVFVLALALALAWARTTTAGTKTARTKTARTTKHAVWDLSPVSLLIIGYD